METIGLDKTKIDLSNVSLVSIETRAPDLAVFIIQRCRAMANFKESLLLGARPHDLPDGINQVDIGPINSHKDYSDFMIRRLGDYIHGDYVLIVQWDGFIIHPECWTPDFLSVDYIGAPWPDGIVGNSGFSMRSRRLIDALKNLNDDMIYPCDVYFCRRHREELESKHGIVFAPVELAKKFSFEESDPGMPTFGFHGDHNFPRMLSETELKKYLTLFNDDYIFSDTGRQIVKSLYRNGRYSDARHILSRRMKGSSAMRWDSLLLLVRSFFHQWRQLLTELPGLN
jgi:hypothetical protein